MDVSVPGDAETEVARRIKSAALQCWGHAVALIGRHPTLAAALDRLERFAESDGPVLITGETGTGKELFARALYLLSRRRGRPFIGVNCPQYQDGNIVASQLFGYARGSFTGALADREGVFEAANGGVVFLDEVGELTPQTQAMLLRVLGAAEVVRVGETCCRRIDVRVVAATSRDLSKLVEAGQFRADLHYRLRCLQIHVPPLRERGLDWQLLLEHELRILGACASRRKTFSRDALRLLADYRWPGNVREVKAVADAGFHVSSGDTVLPQEIASFLDARGTPASGPDAPSAEQAPRQFGRLVGGEGNFWELVHGPFMKRELTRADVREIVARGLAGAGGSYKRLLRDFGLPDDDYVRFMDFLRHHRLKPSVRT